MADEQHSSRTAIIVALIAAFSLVIAAIIGGMATWLSSQNVRIPNAARNEASDELQAIRNTPLIFEKIEAIPQFVNRKFQADESGTIVPIGSNHETSTYRIVLRNTGTSVLHITKGEFVVDSVTTSPELGSTLVNIQLISHDGHIESAIKVPRVGDIISFPVNLPVAPDARREIIVWFRGIDREAPTIVNLTGRLRIHANSSSITSHPIDLELHRETQDMTSQPFGDRFPPPPE